MFDSHSQLLLISLQDNSFSSYKACEVVKRFPLVGDMGGQKGSLVKGGGGVHIKRSKRSTF